MLSTENRFREEASDEVSNGPSSLVSRNITIMGRRTSVRLEPEMWSALRDIAKREKCTMHDICSLIFARKKFNTSLTAAVRVFLMLYYKSAATEDGHLKAGHGDFTAMRKRARFTSDDDLRLLDKKRPLFGVAQANKN